MKQCTKLHLALVFTGVFLLLFYLNETRRSLAASTGLFFNNATENGSAVSLKLFPASLLEGLMNGYFNWSVTKGNPETPNLIESHLIPLRGIGDSFLPFEEMNTSNFEKAPPQVLLDKKMTKDSLVALEKGKTPLKKILFWNDVFGHKDFYLGFGQEPFVAAKCPISSCFATADRNLFSPEEVDAVIWHVRSGDKSLPSKRSSHTRYVFWLLESPMHVYTNLKRFENVFNWTFTYRLDSDFPSPFGRVYRSRELRPLPVDKNYAFGKTKFAAWFVSNCVTKSGRATLVSTLQRWINVDVYGRCGRLKCSRSQGYSKCYDTLERDYKFYFSFENSLCKDYATEKIFYVLQYNVIPVVYGLFNYTAHIPPGSYIDALDFPTAKGLAEYLQYLDKNDTAYNEYFRWKAYHKFPSEWSMLAKPWCDLCARLHEDTSSKVYDIDKWYIADSKCLTDQTPEIARFVNGLPVSNVTGPTRKVTSSKVG
ncbi:alpha-(1,3)-fucosyltransferase C-like [Macrobrachium rosenbergii]|uniref:alpha-(1,3)-fucosyltransferase C-like n=1 Tax=Macrobrachium rosenbergii TaxID=79674 RepID=UPI0034D3D3AA